MRKRNVSVAKGASSILEELNLAEDDSELQPKAILIAKEMLYEDKQRLKSLLKQYKDVFA